MAISFKEYISEQIENVNTEEKFFKVDDKIAKELLSKMPEWFQEAVDFNEWKMGLEVEQEHNIEPFNVVNGDKSIVAKIAAIHLCESETYYTDLKEVEK
jgi:hypothetical protein